MITVKKVTAEELKNLTKRFIGKKDEFIKRIKELKLKNTSTNENK